MNILQVKKIFPSNQKQIIEPAKFTYSPLEKAFEKQTKTIEDQRDKQIEALKVSKPEEALKAIKPEENQKSIERIFPKK